MRTLQRRAVGIGPTLAVGLFFFVASPAQGQVEGQASIIGVVTDASAAVLPGVTVTATSPALQVREVTTVTDGRGAYRLSALPIGTYAVTFALSGFQGLTREGLRLTAGFTATIDASLKVGALEETITVSGASPIVDVTSTKSVTTLTRETLELLPTSRNGVQALLEQAPGVRSNLDIGGNTAGAIPQFRVFGSTAGTWPIIEGIPVGLGGGGSGVYLDYQSLEEAVVSTVGNSAEMPTRGILLSTVVKSGSNAYHGSASVAYAPRRWIADNVDARLRAQGTSAVDILRRADGGGDLGGRIIPNKLWFYGGARERVNDNVVPDCLKPDGSACATEIEQRFLFGKTTYQMTPAQRLVGYYQWNLKDNVSGTNAFIPWESRVHQRVTGDLGKAEWQATLRSNLVATALFGLWNLDSYNLPTDSTNPSTIDIVTQVRSGADGNNASFSKTRYYQSKYIGSGSLTWFAPDSLAGDHNVKIGFDYIQGANSTTGYPRGATGDYVLRFSNGAPFQIQIFNNPVEARQEDRYVSLFAQDQWRVSSRMTIALGMRAAFDQSYVPPQQREGGSFLQAFPAGSYGRIDIAPWNSFVPRMHASYDLTGDGKTVVKGGWGRFAAVRAPADAAYVNPLARSAMIFRWSDLNRNGNYDPGETNLDPNGTDFVSNAFGFGNGILNPDEKAMGTDEFMVSAERELVPGFAARVTGVYSKDTNVASVINPLIPFEAYTIPITNPDPGPDAVLGNADDPGTTITYWEYPRALQGGAFVAQSRVNDPRLDRSYTSAEVAVTRRLANRWQAMGSYSVTKIDEPGGVASPNAQLFGDNRTTEWTAKAGGSVELPFAVLTSLNYSLRQGSPWQRTHLFRGGTTIPTLVVPVEPLGTQRYDNIHLLDARVRKHFRFSVHTVDLGLDIFNLLNVNTITSVTNRSGPRFGFATSTASVNGTAVLPFIPGRNVQLTMNYSF